MFVDVTLVLILLSIWIGIYQLFKQQGRILLRLDRLEEQAANKASAAEPPTLAVGELFPSFTLPDLNGKTVNLADFRQKQVLLVNWNPACGFCDLLAPDLALLQDELCQQRIQLLLLTHGDAQSNRKLVAEHGLRCPILLLDDAPPPKPLEHMGTPVAYLLDTEGRVAAACAVGADDVLSLARSAIRKGRLPGQQPLSKSSILRDGLKAGTLAPPFRLPDIHGRTVALDDYRGRKVLLVFSDPDCGPCDALAPQLAEFEQQHRGNGLDFIMIGRGDTERNRQKAEQYNIQFPFVLQDKWKLSKQYGIFATPVAFLVDENGVIVQDAAVGSEAIQQLASQATRKD